MKKLIKRAIRNIILFIQRIFSTVNNIFNHIVDFTKKLFGFKNTVQRSKNSSSPSNRIIAGRRVSIKGKTPAVSKPYSFFIKNKKLILIAASVLVIASVTVTVVALATGEKKTVAAQNSQYEPTVAVEDVSDSAGDTELASTVLNQIENTIGAQTQDIPAITPAPTPIQTTQPVVEELIPGVSDPRVISIQQRLMELGYLDWDEPSDYYGFGTEYALQLFQRKHNLQVDGIAGDVTLDELYSDDAMPYTVKLGDRGTDVSSLQVRLQELNYLKAGSTGYFGTDTEAAVKSFQKRNGLYADGNVGEQTREALYSEGAKAASTSSSSSGSSSSGTSTGNKPVVVGDPSNASADALIAFAITQLGKPYVRGGKGPSTFDCSGFVYYCLNSVGFKINYMTSTAWRSANFTTINTFTDARKGDILCFNGHVGIYMGDGKMIDASSSNGKIVIRTNIFNSSYWTSNFRCAKRVFD